MEITKPLNKSQATIVATDTAWAKRSAEIFEKGLTVIAGVAKDGCRSAAIDGGIYANTVAQMLRDEGLHAAQHQQVVHINW